MAAIVTRDSLENGRRVQHAAQQDKLYGQEMARTMWGTSLIWGFGMPLMRRLFDGAMHALGKPFVGMHSSDLLDTKNPLYKNQMEYMRQWASAAEKEGGQLEKLAGNLRKVIGKTGEQINPSKLKLLYEALGGARFLIASAVPSALIGIGIPMWNHQSSKKQALAEAMAQQANKPRTQAGIGAEVTSNSPIIYPNFTGRDEPQPFIPTPATNYQRTPVYSSKPVQVRQAQIRPELHTLGARPIAPFGNSGTTVNSASPVVLPNRDIATTYATWAPPPVYSTDARANLAPALTSGGALAELLRPLGGLLRLVHTNDKMANLIGIDGFISIPRILGIRRTGNKTNPETGEATKGPLVPSEMANWFINESIYVYMMYFGAQKLNGLFKRVAGQIIPGFQNTHGVEQFEGAKELLNMPFALLKNLNETYVKPNKLGHLAGDINHAFKELGLSPTADHKGFAQHLIKPETTKELKQRVEQALLPGRYKPGNNLLLDLAADAEIIPVMRDGTFGNGAIKALDPTKTITFANKLNASEPKGLLNGLKHELKLLVDEELTVTSSYKTLQGLLYRMNKLHTLASLPENQGLKAMKTMLQKTTLAKAFCLISSLTASFVVLAEGVPFLQKFVAEKLYHEEASAWTHHGVDEALKAQQAESTASESEATDDPRSHLAPPSAYSGTLFNGGLQAAALTPSPLVMPYSARSPFLSPKTI